jgi:hypothetical protein
MTEIGTPIQRTDSNEINKQNENLGGSHDT